MVSTDLTLSKCNVKASCSNFGFFMGSNKKKWKTKAAAVPCLVDEDGSKASINDHEELGVENDDLEELRVENELEQHANQNVDQVINLVGVVFLY